MNCTTAPENQYPRVINNTQTPKLFVLSAAPCLFIEDYEVSNIFDCPSNGQRCVNDSVSANQWRATSLLYTCSYITFYNISIILSAFYVRDQVLSVRTDHHTMIIESRLVRGPRITNLLAATAYLMFTFFSMEISL